MARVAIFTLRTTIGQERNAAMLIQQKAALRKLNVKSILVPESLRGYLFIEAHPMAIEDAIAGIPHVRSKVVGKVAITELDNLLMPKPNIEQVEQGAVVEIISGPFKGSTARISQVNMPREEVTVELLDSPVTIPVVIHADYVRIIRTANSEPISSEISH
ncbi:MAG: transcription elongation factor Spt5 [Candidatus Hodarchaeales archaeon]|jgi:transcriptional antiterminator NusG